MRVKVEVCHGFIIIGDASKSKGGGVCHGFIIKGDASES